MKRGVLGGLSWLLAATAACWAQVETPLRPPAVPLVTHDPYFSIWSPADKLTDADTMHWTGKPHRLTSLVYIDSSWFRILGASPADFPVLAQKSLTVLPTRTITTFEGAGVRLTLTFMTPMLPDDLMICSRPVTYLTWEVNSLDGREHEVWLRFTASPEIAVNDSSQEVVWGEETIGDLKVSRVGTANQPILGRKGDDIRIDWGHLYAAARKDQGPTQLVTPQYTPDRQMPRAVNDNVPRLWIDFVLKKVTAQPVSRWLMLAYDDEFAIKYFGRNLRPYWRRNGDDAAALLKKAAADYESLAKRCAAFDEALMSDLRKVGGEQYAALCALAYRQTFAGNKLAADANGMPLLFPKENFSNGCISTVDVLFPQAPFFLVFSPALTRAMLVPVLEYAASPLWPYGYAPHDLGTYPWALGQVYGIPGGDGDRMPVEESGNMLIMLAALAKIEGQADLAKKYWPMLTKWADYLVANGLDPENQLCSADMFGHLPHCANLALKAIIGIGGYAQLCQVAGKPEDAGKYMSIARDYAAKWQQMARDEGRTRLAYHLPGTWGMKHNLIWDRVLGLHLFPDAVGDAEIAWYLKVQNPYGLPVDNRTDTSLIDWALWSIAPARDRKDFEALVAPLFRYANETPSRVPLSDWFVTTDAKQKGFQARPVVGGIFIKLLTDAPAWAQRAAKVTSDWAPFPEAQPVTLKEIVPTAQQQPVTWRYTLEQPGDDWFRPGFDDAAWTQAPAGFGTAHTPGAVVRTEWQTKDIWLRRAFTLPDAPLKQAVLLMHYDESPDVYLNGVLAARLDGYVTAYDEVAIAPAARATLKPGRNILAVHCRQTTGGQYIDVGLADENEAATLRPLFDFPVRDTCVCLGPDDTYYLTGTTGHPTWWNTNEGIRVWKSKDLKTWEPLGLVWSFARDATWQKPKDNHQAIWAPELHYFKGTFWFAYCVNYGGTGILRSKSGKAEGPYEDVKPDGPLTGDIDASLFADDDGQVYFVWQNGKIARLKDDLSGLAEEPRQLKPANAPQVGFEGAFLTKINGRYQLICAEFNKRGQDSTYDCMAAGADSLYGPYGDAYLAIPHGGHNMLFKDAQGHWWSTFFGNDPQAPFRERPAILPIHLNAAGNIEMGR